MILNDDVDSVVLNLQRQQSEIPLACKRNRQGHGDGNFDELSIGKNGAKGIRGLAS